ncbi:NADH-quinone oxidoreductase subunit NuoE [Sinimarinibacterium sp. CAU 1509]|uniref:NADH-quinone oxidoreductase subunit NuoE n=1 Tax=Sinimarinibacterium sp. CAU 1509 TaxID=2562283 RepID=UPI0010ABCCB7|nr:NADH-quinone oxidoreductase subunit NuoE [Sinimarinibacterium sp. CAU 1509]TJY64748.1 NADH-quinone oxidoreductase subunit NuoE [Sinimarinibacterium sp. CAU 1509]
MLTPDELREIEHELSHYAQPQAATIEALKIVQKHRGWVSDEAVADIATALNSTPATVDAVASFYNLIYRKPVGRHVIHVCDSVSCWIMGQTRLSELLKARLGIDYGQTTPDGRFTLLPICCLGTCDRAPAMLIGSDTHRDLESVDAARLDALLERYP